MSVVGLVIVSTIVFLAIFADYVSPYPESAYLSNYAEKFLPPSFKHPFGTDDMGRDILSRVFFGCRSALLLGVIVIIIAVPIGSLLGLIAGYFQGSLVDLIIMRATDIFMAIPGIISALVVAAILGPSLINMIFAIAFFWWPWYSRIVYGATIAIKNEFFVIEAKLTGAKMFHILFREIFPHCLPTLLTKATLDMGWVILAGSTLSFLGLGAQPPTPDLGTMVADGRIYMPTYWWISICPGLVIVVLILGFNFIGDGLRDVLAIEEF